MNMENSMAQAIGLFASVLVVLSFQSKSSRSLLMWQIIASLCFALHYGLLGPMAYTAALMNMVSILRCVWFYFKKGKPQLFSLGIISALYLIIFAFTHAGIPSLIAIAAQLGSTYIFWKGDILLSKRVALYVISPLWIVHNIMVLSIGGIICEATNILLLLLFFMRYHKNDTHSKKSVQSADSQTNANFEK